MNKEQLAQQMYGKSYADLTISEQIRVDDAFDANKPASGTQDTTGSLATRNGVTYQQQFDAAGNFLGWKNTVTGELVNALPSEASTGTGPAPAKGFSAQSLLDQGGRQVSAGVIVQGGYEYRDPDGDGIYQAGSKYTEPAAAAPKRTVLGDAVADVASRVAKPGLGNDVGPMSGDDPASQAFNATMQPQQFANTAERLGLPTELDTANYSQRAQGGGMGAAMGDAFFLTQQADALGKGQSVFQQSGGHNASDPMMFASYGLRPSGNAAQDTATMMAIMAQRTQLASAFPELSAAEIAEIIARNATNTKGLDSTPTGTGLLAEDTGYDTGGPAMLAAGGSGFVGMGGGAAETAYRNTMGNSNVMLGRELRRNAMMGGRRPFAFGSSGASPPAVTTPASPAIPQMYADRGGYIDPERPSQIMGKDQFGSAYPMADLIAGEWNFRGGRMSFQEMMALMEEIRASGWGSGRGGTPTDDLNFHDRGNFRPRRFAAGGGFTTNGLSAIVDLENGGIEALLGAQPEKVTVEPVNTSAIPAAAQEEALAATMLAQPWRRSGRPRISYNTNPTRGMTNPNLLSLFAGNKRGVKFAPMVAA